MMTGEEWLAQHRAQRLQGMTEKERAHYQIAKKIARECGEAWAAAKNGASHPRLYTKTPEQRYRELRTKRYAERAAFFPQLPDKGWGDTFKREEYLDYRDRRYGPGGAEYME